MLRYETYDKEIKYQSNGFGSPCDEYINTLFYQKTTENVQSNECI